MDRCTDPDLGVKVLSHDLLEGDEKAELEKHLEECKACGDLFVQTFGDAGALRDIDLRAWHMTRRRPVAPHEWFVQRVMSLWVPGLLLAFGIGALVLYLARRPPDPERVELLRLATSRRAELDSVSTLPLPRLAPVATSLIVEADQDAIVLLYESGDGYLRRLLPGGAAEVPELRGGETHELAVPELDDASASLLLVLAPSAAPRAVDAWDRAVWLNLGGEARDGEQRGWPEGVAATLRWVR